MPLPQDDDDDDFLVEEDQEGSDDGAPEDYDSADDYDDELFKNDQDKAELLAKTDLEREMILADRHDRKQRRIETLQVRRQMQEQRKKASASQRSASSRARTATAAVDSKKEKLAQMAAKRAAQQQSKELERSARDERRRQEPEQRAAAKAEAAAEGSDDGELDEGHSRRRQERGEPAPLARPEEPAEREAEPAALERIRLTRTKIEKWLNEPFFERAVVGCFVRVGIGQSDQKPIYRVAEVIGVKDGFRQYKIEQRQTTKRLELQIGSSRRYFEIAYVSNTNFDMPELEKYVRIMKDQRKPFKTLTYINDKVRTLKGFNNYEYNHKEVEQKVRPPRSPGRRRRP